MTKEKIIEIFEPNLKNKSKFLRFCQNNYFKYVKAEMMFQFFVCEILEQNGYTVIRNNGESKKTSFERYMSTYLGNEKGVSDIYVTQCKTGLRGVYFELKSGIEKVYTKKLELKKDSTGHLALQDAFIKKMKSQGFIALFLYPENIQDNFSILFGIDLKM